MGWQGMGQRSPEHDAQGAEVYPSRQFGAVALCTFPVRFWSGLGAPSAGERVKHLLSQLKTVQDASHVLCGCSAPQKLPLCP